MLQQDGRDTIILLSYCNLLELYFPALLVEQTLIEKSDDNIGFDILSIACCNFI